MPVFLLLASADVAVFTCDPKTVVSILQRTFESPAFV